MRPFSAILLGGGSVAAIVGGGSEPAVSYSADPHRYWRVRVTAAMNAGALAAMNNVVLAEQRGGAHALGAVTPVASSTNTGTAANAQDSSISSIWVGQTMPITLTWDLGVTSSNWKDVREFRLNVDPAWHPQGPKTFSVQYSDDNVSWTDRITVASETGWDGSANTGWRARIFRSSSQPIGAAGYYWFRLNITAGVDATQCAIGEIELRASLGGADQIASTSAGFFSQQAGGNPWSTAYDNNTSNGWFGTTGFPYTAGVELPQRIVLAQVSIMPFLGFQAYAPKDFKIEGSNDPAFAVWDTLSTITAQTGWANAPTARLFNV